VGPLPKRRHRDDSTHQHSQMAVDRHHAAVDTTQDANDSILTNWGAELNRLKDRDHDIRHLREPELLPTV